MLKKFLIGLGAFVILFFTFNSVLMPWYVKHADLVKVPNITGLNFIDAKTKLEEAGLEIKQGNFRYDESVPLNQVMDQEPQHDQMVKYGRRVYVTLCGGEQLVEVPKLIGRSIRDAKFALEQRNLQVGEVMKKFSNEYNEDMVVSQIIQPGSKVKRSSKIDLIISNGVQVGDIIIPDVIGKKLEEAKKLITDKKLKVGKVTYQTSELPPGQVIDQYPKKDKSANESTSVDLFIAKKKKIETVDETVEDNYVPGKIEDFDGKVEPPTEKQPDTKQEKPKETPTERKEENKLKPAPEKNKKEGTEKNKKDTK